MKLRHLICFCLLLCVGLFACKSKGEQADEAVAHIDLPQIQEQGKLVVLTINSSTSYFNYRGEPMGFQYELAQQFAKSLGLEL